MAKKKKKSDEQEWKQTIIALIVLIILVAIIVVYIFTFGKFNYLKEDENEKRAKRIKWIEDKLAELHYQYKTKEELKAKLDLQVKKYFFRARILIVAIFLVLNSLCYFFLTSDKKGFSDKLSVLLNYNQGLFLLILAALFIIYETSAEIKDVVKVIHLYIKKVVYEEHKELENEVIEINIEISKLTEEQNKLKEQDDDGRVE